MRSSNACKQSNQDKPRLHAAHTTDSCLHATVYIDSGQGRPRTLSWKYAYSVASSSCPGAFSCIFPPSFVSPLFLLPSQSSTSVARPRTVFRLTPHIGPSSILIRSTLRVRLWLADPCRTQRVAADHAHHGRDDAVPPSLLTRYQDLRQPANTVASCTGLYL